MSQQNKFEEGRSFPDPAELMKSYSEVAKRASQMLAQHVDKKSVEGFSMPSDEMGISKAFADLSACLLSNPQKLAEAQMKLMRDYFSLWQYSTMKMMGSSSLPAVVTPLKSDKRFKDDEWESNFLFDFIKQSYLLTANHLNGIVSDVEGLDESTQRKVSFFTRQYTDALSPTNFALSNPEVVRETVSSNGQNLVRGFDNLLRDMEAGDGQLRVRMTDPDAFELGRNVATTPGKVIFQNDMFQLIQYDPSTPQQFKKPLLIVPPWINKYYILDLRDKNSFVKWATDQGHTTFIMSWVNPDERYADKNFEDYLLDGTMAAIDAIEQATGEARINAASYCLGGTLLMSTLAYMSAKRDKRIASATFFTSMLDFSEPGELKVFLDEATVAGLETRMDERGFLDGADMAGTFNMLRANDLIWSFAVNNYLMGKESFPFDLLYWNSDSTRMPAKMHSFYLRNFYLGNKLREAGGVVLGGVKIDLSKVKTPCYFVSAIEDHIAPWKSTYMGALLPSGPVKFVLGGSGHIAGIINPPAANKYGYWTNTELPESADDFLAGATQTPGSWWTDWQQWVTDQVGGAEKVRARKPGAGNLKVIEDAPGSYVKFRLDKQKKAAE
ncbi:class I poly(R)-hydroxyalkanoic acid synthase [Propionivibrio sp.]|uniref:PHA/PHB synthase family protein n=1 Tax=Propionivibrio sp. TaxID=2212460 RepID=UPI0026171F2B|nr:class I poly(R)-hydroxyalkanoic acid synthase [Propionivibrio sp.]